MREKERKKKEQKCWVLDFVLISVGIAGDILALKF